MKNTGLTIVHERTLLVASGTGDSKTALETLRQKYLNRAAFLHALGYVPFEAALYYEKAANNIGRLLAA